MDSVNGYVFSAKKSSEKGNLCCDFASPGEKTSKMGSTLKEMNVLVGANSFL